MRSSEAFLKWLQENIAAVLVVALVLVVGGSVYAGYGMWRSGVESKAHEAFFRVEKDYLALQEKWQKKDGEAKGPEKTGDIDKDYGEILPRLKGIAKEHSGTNAAYLATLLFSRIQFEHQGYDVAEKALIETMRKQPSSQLLQSLAQVMLGTLLEAQGRCEAAVTYWDTVLTAKSVNFLHADTLLKKALCFENLARTGEARELYERLQKDHAETSAGQKAKAYLRLLDVKKGS